jgi:tRNA pseudouridine55 synthase
LAEGVMIVLTDTDCKKQEKFMKLDKEYEAKILLGASSPSYDLEKQLTFENNIPLINKKALEDVLKSLEGEITLPVPMFSDRGGKNRCGQFYSQFLYKKWDRFGYQTCV